MKTGVVYLKIRCRLDMDVSTKKMREFVEELDYTITSQTKGVSISDTDIVEWGRSLGCNGEDGEEP